MNGRLSRFVQKMGRLRLPQLFWDGTGTIVRKVHIPGREAGAWILIPHVMTRYLGGFVPQRWVLVVRSEEGMDHYVSVEADAWEGFIQGESVTPDRALYPEFGSEVFNANRWKRARPLSGSEPVSSPRTASRRSNPDDRPPAGARAVEADVERRAARLAAGRRAMEGQAQKSRQRARET